MNEKSKHLQEINNWKAILMDEVMEASDGPWFLWMLPSEEQMQKGLREGDGLDPGTRPVAGGVWAQPLSHPINPS